MEVNCTKYSTSVRVPWRVKPFLADVICFIVEAVAQSIDVPPVVNPGVNPIKLFTAVICGFS